MSANGMLENIEEVLMELTSFEKKLTRDDGVEIPQILDDYLIFVARTGNTHFPWMKIKPLFRSKLEKVIREFSQKSDEIPPTPNVDPFQFDVVRDTVFEQLDFFAGIPFTVQRLCELLTAPSKHYKRTDKFMRALEKNMLVVSTIEAVHPSSFNSSSSSLPLGGGVSNGVSDSFSSTLEQREKEAYLLNGSNPPSLAASNDENDEKNSMKSDETGVFSSSPQSNGNTQPDEQQVNGNTSDLEASGPCDSGESSSSENSSPNPHISDAPSDSTTNEAVSSLEEEDEMQSSSTDATEESHCKDDFTASEDLLPLTTDSMEIDSECSSSDNLLIQTSTSSEVVQDEVQSTDEGEQPSKKKLKIDSEGSSSSSESSSSKGDERGEEEEETSPSSSKDDEMRVDKSPNEGMNSGSGTSSSADTCSADDTSRVSTSEDTQEPEAEQSSLLGTVGSSEATPSTSTPSPLDSSPNKADSNANTEENPSQEPQQSFTTTAA